MEPSITFKLCKQHKHDNIEKITLAFEDNCFCFQVTGFFHQKSEFLFKMFINSVLYFTKRPITGKQKQLFSKANIIHQMCMNGKVNQGPLYDINV